MTTGPPAAVIVGRAVPGLMVCTPAPGLLKAMVSVPAWELASRIAWRSDPAPEASVLTTVIIEGVRRSSSGSTKGRYRRAWFDLPRAGPRWRHQPESAESGTNMGNLPFGDGLR